MNRTIIKRTVLRFGLIRITRAGTTSRAQANMGGSVRKKLFNGKLRKVREWKSNIYIRKIIAGALFLSGQTEDALTSVLLSEHEISM